MMMPPPPSSFLQRRAGEVVLMELGMQQNMVVEGDGDFGDPQRLSVGWPRWHHGSTHHGGAASLDVEAVSDPIVRLF